MSCLFNIYRGRKIHENQEFRVFDAFLPMQNAIFLGIKQSVDLKTLASVQ
jgi:hypothetical protein